MSALLLGFLGILTWRQAHIYQTPEMLWRATLASNPGSSMANHNLGLLLYEEGRLNDSLYYLQRAVEENPQNAEAQNALGNALKDKGWLPSAAEHYRLAVALRPDVGMHHANLGSALAIMKMPVEAKESYERALKLLPEDPRMTSNFAWLLATSPDPGVRDGARAVTLAKRAQAQVRGHEDVALLTTLSAAYAASGRFKEAIPFAEDAMRKAQESGDTGTSSWISGILDEYRAGKSHYER